MSIQMVFVTCHVRYVDVTFFLVLCHLLITFTSLTLCCINKSMMFNQQNILLKIKCV